MKAEFNEDTIREAVGEYGVSLDQSAAEGILVSCERGKARRRTVRKSLSLAAAFVVVVCLAASFVPPVKAALMDVKDALFGKVDLEEVYVAQFPESCLTALDIFRSNSDGRSGHENVPIVVRVRAVGEIKDILHYDEQHYRVEEVFRGEGIQAGDEIKINRHRPQIGYPEVDSVEYIWNVDLEDTIYVEMHFSNLMMPGYDYLVFICQQSPQSEGRIKTYDLEDGLVCPHIFCYDDIENKAVSEDAVGRSTYVKYSDVMENEFFGMSRTVLDELESLKKDILKAYPIGSGR